MPDLTALAAEVDTLLPARALVYGSLPESARDLDLLVRDGGSAALIDELRAAGFTCHNGLCARCSPFELHVVEPVDVGQWRLPAPQVEALFEAAQPLPGRTRLAEPAPHHRLLILARRLVAAGGAPSSRHLARVDRALAQDPGAPAAARAAAAAWGCNGALDALLDVHRTGRAFTRREAWAARLAEEVRHGRSTPAAVARLVRRRLRPPPPGAVLDIVGVDTAARSMQAARLAEALQALGFQASLRLSRDAAEIGAALRRGEIVVRARDEALTAPPALAVYDVADGEAPDDLARRLLFDAWERLSAR